MNETVLEDPSKYFWLVTGTPIRSIIQLIEAVPEITDEQFNYHVNDQKNDFYNWITGVFGDDEVAAAIKDVKTKQEFYDIILNLLMGHKKKTKDFVEMQFHEARKKLFMEDEEKFNQFKEQELKREEGIGDHFDAEAQKMDEAQETSILPKTYSRIEALQVREKELREFITETRKEGHDPILAQMVLRRFNSKVRYATLTQDEKDFDKVEQVIDEAERELEAAVMEKLVDAKKEIDLLVSLDLAKLKSEEQAT